VATPVTGLVRLHRRAADRQRAERLGMHLAAPPDQHHQAGHLAGADVAGRDLVQPGQSIRRQQVSHPQSAP
jgi:hypothetical protein